MTGVAGAPDAVPVDGSTWHGLALEEVDDPPAREIESPPDARLQLVLVTAGSYAIESARPGARWERAVMAPGRSAVTPPGREIRARWASDGDRVLRSTHVRIPPRVLEDVAASFPGVSLERVDWLSRDDGYVAGAVRELARARRAGAPALLADSVAVSLVAHLMSLPTVADEDRRAGLSASDLATVLGVMHDRLAEPLSLTDLAASVHMSRYHFLRRFTASTGRTPMRWMTDQRMRHARSLLGGTRIPVAEVAMRCGYATPAAFAAAFRRHHGVSPSDHRGRTS